MLSLLTEQNFRVLLSSLPQNEFYRIRPTDWWPASLRNTLKLSESFHLIIWIQSAAFSCFSLFHCVYVWQHSQPSPLCQAGVRLWVWGVCFVVWTRDVSRGFMFSVVRGQPEWLHHSVLDWHHDETCPAGRISKTSEKHKAWRNDFRYFGEINNVKKTMYPFARFSFVFKPLLLNPKSLQPWSSHVNETIRRHQLQASTSWHVCKTEMFVEASAH